MSAPRARSAGAAPDRSRAPRPSRLLRAPLLAALLLAGCGLNRTTVAIDNGSGETLGGARLELAPQNRRIELGDLPPGARRRVALPRDLGEASLRFVFSAGATERRACGVYVEGRMFRVTIEVDSNLRVRCRDRLAWW